MYELSRVCEIIQTQRLYHPFPKRKVSCFQGDIEICPGKAYPVLKVGELMWWIDSSGFHSQQKILVDFDVCSTFEYGFTNLLLNKEKDFVAKEKAKCISEADARLIYRSMIVSLYPSSYLSISRKLLSTDELAKKHRNERGRNPSVLLRCCHL